MNEQVKRFFKNRLELQTMRIFEENIFQKEELKYVLLEGEGTGVKLPVDNDDTRFVNRVRYLFLDQGYPESSLPKSWRILQARYALLHPLPLHDFVIEFDKAEEQYKISEISKTGRKTEVEFVSNVDKKIYTDYNKTLNKSIPKTLENDKIVGEWWIEENKNCLMDGISPQVKIVLKGQSQVTIAFRKPKAPGYVWYEVKDIPIDIEEFKKKVQSHGFKDHVHAKHLLKMSDEAWSKIVEPDKIGKGGGEVNPAIRKYNFKGTKSTGFNLPFSKLKSMDIRPAPGWTKSKVLEIIKNKDTDPEVTINVNERGKEIVSYKGEVIATISNPASISPGHQKQEMDSSKEFNNLYQNNKHFQTLINNQIKGSVISALKRLGFFSGLKDIDLKSELFQRTFSRFLGRTGRISDEDWKNWETLIGDPHNWRCGKHLKDTNTPFSNTLCQIIGGSAITELRTHYGLGKKAGVMGTIATGQGGDNDQRPDATHQSVTDKDTVGQNDEFDSIVSPEQLIKYLMDNRSSINLPKVQDKIRQMAPKNPILAQLASSLNDLKHAAPGEPEEPDDLMDDDDDDDYQPGNSFRGPTARQQQVPAHQEVYSFTNYLNKRINEMEVVWGNDKNSAKKLKQGQTLKGGIQVQGAPWTAGKLNYKNNDLKIK